MNSFSILGFYMLVRADDGGFSNSYFVGFGMCHKMDPNGTWDENMTLAGWGLAIRPENRRDHGDLSKWKF